LVSIGWGEPNGRNTYGKGGGLDIMVSEPGRLGWMLECEYSSPPGRRLKQGKLDGKPKEGSIARKADK